MPNPFGASGTTASAAAPALRLDGLKPYVSVIVIECTATDPAAAFGRLTADLRRLRKQRTGTSVAVNVVADGVDGQVASGDIELTADAFVVEVVGPPSWANIDSGFTEIRHELAIWMGRGRLVALACSGTLADRVQRWLDASPTPPYRRVEPGILHAALLGGQAKTLWLRGTHTRRATKADTKTISGPRLQDAMDPAADGSFAMGSARVEIDPAITTLSGLVGTTPRKSSVWFGSSTDMADFTARVGALLQLLQDCIERGVGVERPYPLLATPINDLAVVHDAYDISCPSPDELALDELTPDTALAVDLLQDAELVVHPIAGSPNFVIGAGLDGVVGGHLLCTVMRPGGRVRLRLGFSGQPTDLQLVRPVLDALQQCEDLLTVRYESGHSLSIGGIWSIEIGTAPFPNWTWSDFSGYDVRREKPVDQVASQVIHDEIGRNGDASLFAWAVQHFGQGAYLTCDDGSGEAADFIRLGYDESLTLIHVKASSRSTTPRRLNVGRHEVVVSQASKNAGYLDVQRLADRLASSTLARPATWDDGVRIPTRDDMVTFLRDRSASAPKAVVIFQPLITRAAYDSGWAENAGPESTRVRLLDTLVNSARGSIVGYGADLHVYASA